MGEFESVKPYTQAELDQQAIWANEFAQWWENEGQYQRAGGGQYERSFAWWAWLDREQSKQAIIDDLKAQLNNMEACYVERKKEAEDQQGRVSRALNFINNWWHPDLDQKLFVEAVANALRGDGD